MATAIVAFVVHRMATPVPGVGISVPTFAPPLLAAGVALVLSRRFAAPIAYIGGSLGVLIGADLLNLGLLRSLGAPVASIGGAGTFDGIFLTGVIAVLLASLVVEQRWLTERYQICGDFATLGRQITCRRQMSGRLASNANPIVCVIVIGGGATRVAYGVAHQQTETSKMMNRWLKGVAIAALTAAGRWRPRRPTFRPGKRRRRRCSCRRPSPGPGSTSV